LNIDGRKLYRCEGFDDFVSKNKYSLDKIVLNIKWLDMQYTGFYRYRIDKKILEIGFDD
jgi:hypothetical protein